MAEQKDDALLLRALPFSDSSLILHILTKDHGRISLMARGARRAKSPFRARLMPLHHLNIRWKEPRTGSMGTLIEAQRVKPLLHEQKILAGQLILAKASILFPDSVSTGFSELWNALHTLSQRPEDSGVAAGIWSMLEQSGWVGDFKHCWQCSEPIDFSENMAWHQAHLLCLDCANHRGIKLNSGCRKSLHHHLIHAEVRLSKEHIKTWQTMIDTVFASHQMRN